MSHHVQPPPAVPCGINGGLTSPQHVNTTRHVGTPSSTSCQTFPLNRSGQVVQHPRSPTTQGMGTHARIFHRAQVPRKHVCLQLQSATRKQQEQQRRVRKPRRHSTPEASRNGQSAIRSAARQRADQTAICRSGNAERRESGHSSALTRNSK